MQFFLINKQSTQLFSGLQRCLSDQDIPLKSKEIDKPIFFLYFPKLTYPGKYKTHNFDQFEVCCKTSKWALGGHQIRVNAWTGSYEDRNFIK